MSSLKFLISKFDESIEHSFVGDITFPIQGLFVVDLPDGAQIDTPSSYNDLKTKKMAAIAEMWPDYPTMVYNELDNDSNVDRTSSLTRCHTGSYEWMLPRQISSSNGRITTNSTTLSGIPIDVIVLWSVYSLSREDGLAGKDITYNELDTTDITVELSLDNGGTWTTVEYSETATPSVLSTDMRLRFTNTNTSEDRYIGYYVVLYRT